MRRDVLQEYAKRLSPIQLLKINAPVVPSAPGNALKRRLLVKRKSCMSLISPYVLSADFAMTTVNLMQLKLSKRESLLITS